MADGTITIETDLDSSGAEKGVSKLENSLNKVSSKISNVGKTVAKGVTVATGALGALGIKSIGVASDLQEIQNVVDVTFGEGASVINDWAKTVKNSFGLSELQAKKYSSTLGAMMKSSGLSAEASRDMAMSMTELTADMASFYNLDHEEAFEKIKSGISGETEPLKALGINMSVANMEAFALSKGINKSWNEMSQAEQTTLRYQYIMAQTADAQGDFARTSDGLANSTRTAKITIQEIAQKLGDLLLPIAQNVMIKVNELGNKMKEALDNPEIQASIQNLAQKLGELALKLLDMAVNYLPQFINGLTWFLNNLPQITALFVGLYTTVKTFMIINTIVKAYKAWTTATTGLTIAQKLLNLVMLANPIGIIIGLIAGLVAAFVVLWNTSDTFRDKLTSAWNTIKSVFDTVWTAIADFFTVTIPQIVTSVINWFAQLPTRIGEFFNQLWNSIVTWVSNTWNSLVNGVKNIVESVINFFATLPERIAYCLGFALGRIVAWGQEVYNFITVKIPEIINKIIEWFAQLPSRIWNCLVDVVTKVIEWRAQMINKAIEVGRNFINSIIDFFRQLPSNVATWFNNTINKASEFVGNMANKAREAGRQFKDTIVNALTSLPNKMAEIGKNIVRGIWNGITGSIGWLKNKISSVCGSIVDGFKDGLGIHSPSRVLRDMVGKFIPQGISVGIEDEMPQLTKNTLANLKDYYTKLQNAVNNNLLGTGIRSIGNNYVNNIINNPTPNIKNTIENVLNIDGREVARSISPYQSEFDNYALGR